VKGIYWLGLGIVSLPAFFINSCFAQSSNIVPDNSLGAESSRVVPLDASGFPIDVIDSGAVRGANLFHSFAEFNVAELRGVYFLNPSNAIQNILARVTGNNRSEILGTLGILNNAGVTSRPNLFLINPNGILFGENASLDLGGSFVASTANGINLGETGFFSATEPQRSNLLSVNPSALFFNAVNNQAEIINRSRATSTVLGFTANGDANRSINGLQVLDGKSLLLIGGNVSLDGGIVTAQEGRVELGSVFGESLVSLNKTDKGLVLGYEGVQNFGDIKISGDIAKNKLSLLNTTGNKGGNIQIYGRELLLKNGSLLVTGARNEDKEGGEIFIQTTDNVTVDDSAIGNFLGFGNSGSINIKTKELNVFGRVFNFGGFITTSTNGEGKAGDITIKVERLSLTNGGEIQADTFDKGNAGNITIIADDFVEVIGTSSINNNPSTISNNVNINASGNGGKLLIDTKRLIIRDGAHVEAGTLGTGKKGGTLTIIALESVEISGTNGNGNSSGLFTATFGTNAGDLTIDTGKLTIHTGGKIQADTFDRGNSGNITIRADDSVEVIGKSSLDNNLSTISTQVRSNSSGNGGNLIIETKRLIVRDGARVQTDTFDRGNAGNITIRADDSVEVIGKSLLDNKPSTISTQVNINAPGSGGNLLIDTKRSIIRDGAQVQAGTFGTGKGGSLTIIAPESVEISGTNGGGSPSGLFTATYGGAEAGDLTINTGKLTVLKGGTVSASTAALLGEAKGGNLTINATDSVEVDGFLQDDDDGTFFSSLVTETGRLLSLNIGINPARGGNLTINTGRLKISDGGRVSSATYGLAGQAGNLIVNARESIQISGNQSRLTAKTNSTGNAGDLRIRTQKLVIQKGAEVSTSTSGDNEAFRVRNRGQGGILDVNASDSVKISGVSSGLVSFSLLSTGDAGKIKINTRRLIIRDGATVSTSSFGRGRGGDLEVTASDFIEINGSGISFVNDISSAREVGLEQFTSRSSLSTLTTSTKDAGNININTRQLFVRDGGEIIANTFGFGKGGDVRIQVDSAFLENNASISSNSGSEQSNPNTRLGNAGNIFIDVRNNLRANNGTISTTSATSSGGIINITAKDIRLFGDSDIRTNIFNGTGGGGNITLTANTIVALDDSDILSFAREGEGGDITFNTAGFFSKPLFRPTPATTDANTLATLNGNNRVDVNASGAVNGAITGVPNITFIDENLTDLPDNQFDTNALIANSCIARSTQRQENSFTITGSGGLRNSPGDRLISIYSTGDVRNVETTPRPWKKGDPIIEPTGVYKLPDGRLLLSRKCS